MKEKVKERTNRTEEREKVGEVKGKTGEKRQGMFRLVAVVGGCSMGFDWEEWDGMGSWLSLFLHASCYDGGHDDPS